MRCTPASATQTTTSARPTTEAPAGEETPAPQRGSPPAKAGNGNGNFGRNNYYTSIFGTPSVTKPFMVSFNGHHLSFNITFDTSGLGNTPEFTGTEPSHFILDSKNYQPMKLESDAVFGLLKALP